MWFVIQETLPPGRNQQVLPLMTYSAGGACRSTRIHD
jgi:hypothetical protein